MQGFKWSHVLKYLVYKFTKTVAFLCAGVKTVLVGSNTGNYEESRVGEVFLEVLGHAEGLDLLGSEHRGHGLVGGEPLLVLGVLQLLLLKIGPEPLDTLRKNDVRQKLKTHGPLT